MLEQSGAVWILYSPWYSTSGGTLNASFARNTTAQSHRGNNIITMLVRGGKESWIFSQQQNRMIAGFRKSNSEYKLCVPFKPKLKPVHPSSGHFIC